MVIYGLVCLPTFFSLHLNQIKELNVSEIFECLMNIIIWVFIISFKKLFKVLKLLPLNIKLESLNHTIYFLQLSFLITYGADEYQSTDQMFQR